MSKDKEYELKRYVHAGVRLLHGKKVKLIYLLNADDTKGELMHFPANGKDKHLVGMLFEDEFAEGSARLSTYKAESLGCYHDKALITHWIAQQIEALANDAKTSAKQDTYVELEKALAPQREAYANAMKRRDYEGAQAIKELVLLALTRSP